MDRNAMTDNRPSDSSANADRNAGIVTRRRALMMGAITASAVVSIKPALAQTAGSVLAADGTVVSPDTPGAFPPAGRNFTGEEVRQAMNGRTLPGTSYDQSQAYVNYIRRLQAGQSGFTCYASLQMPR